MSGILHNRLTFEYCCDSKILLVKSYSETIFYTMQNSIKKIICLIFTGFIILGVAACKTSQIKSEEIVPSEKAQEVPFGGNTWASEATARKSTISQKGIVQWESKETSFKTFFRVNEKGSLKLWLRGNVGEGASVLEIRVAGKSKKVNLNNESTEDVFAGEWSLQDTGYVEVELKGLSKTGRVFADLESLVIDGEAVNEGTRYVKNNEGNFFYWGRRGPSVHLAYQTPKDQDIMWYYNEITVPEGEDVIGSYYMANGFSGGYFGIQVNSETERRVLFSVWSPYQTDDPNEIPEDYKIKLLKKGKGVNTGEFGNEGSGGQSFLRYNWKTGNTYKFLLKGEPIENNYTNYTAWFFAPEEGKWQLIASFSRPKTHSWLTGFHSFLENFSPNQGIYERKVNFSNQWVANKNGNWTEVNEAKFTADNTARTGYRMDYGGGEENGVFYLRNCGFFSDYTAVDTFFTRPLTGEKPEIDFSVLP